MRSPLKWLPILTAFASLSFNGCTSMLLVKSSWNDNQIVVDGKDNDWGDTMFYIPDAQMTAGIRNDSNYMYVILRTSNRQQTFQMLGLGLTLWFDPSGGTGQKFGIHFPLGRMEGGNYMRREEGAAENPDDNQNQNYGFTGMTQNEFELLGVNENGPVRLSIADAKGIELQLNDSQTGLIYELRVPLRTSPDHPYAINAKGTSIGVGFEGGKFQRPEGGSRGRRGGGEGEGQGGEGGGEGTPPGGYGRGTRGGGRGRSSGGEERQAPKQIDFWLKVRLASESGQASLQQ